MKKDKPKAATVKTGEPVWMIEYYSNNHWIFWESNWYEESDARNRVDYLRGIYDLRVKYRLVRVWKEVVEP